jgi:folylpolyglutamate synthase/dihydropteroate synthase
VIADVAHNVEKVAGLAEELALRYPNSKLHFILGLTRGRDALAVFAPILKLASRITITTASYAGRDPHELANLLREKAPQVDIEVVADGREAYQAALASRSEDDLIVLTGSAYMIDQTLNPSPYLRHTNSSYGWRYQIESPGDLGNSDKL